MQDPDPTFRPVVGHAEELEPGLRRILAPNPSPMTYRGTNTYLLGTSEVAVIDPGPEDSAHLEAILAATNGGAAISHIIVTHAHIDHSPLSRRLSQTTGVAISAMGDHLAGRSEVMTALAASGMAGGGEGVDYDFAPDILLSDGELLRSLEWELEVIYTPGHFGNHIALGWGDVCFTADLVMGWASSLVSPPDGDLTDFMASCRRLAARDWRRFHTGHGRAIDDPAARLDWLISHRLGREAEILSALDTAPGTAADLASRIYTDVPPALMGAATRNVFAHLVDLHGRSMVETAGSLSSEATFTRA